jgi:hypothetical protein
MGFRLFIESFVAKVFHEDLGMIFNLPMLADPQVTFTMFLLCYAQRHGYLLCIMFLFLGILQHYIKFNIGTTATLEKILGVRSFGGSINHLTCHQGILLVSSNGFNLFFVI